MIVSVDNLVVVIATLLLILLLLLLLLLLTAGVMAGMLIVTVEVPLGEMVMVVVDIRPSWEPAVLESVLAEGEEEAGV